MSKRNDLIGQKFGRLTIIKKSECTKNRVALYECLCDCGNVKNIRLGDLKTGDTKSCGCLRKEKISELRKFDLTGKRFGRLKVIKDVGKSKDRNIIWECLCDCGKIKNIKGNNLMQGRTKSCGCLNKEITSNRSTTHGLSQKEPLYCVWRSMRDRCYNKNNSSYNRYGGRGIIVCDEWKNNVELFYNWMVSNGYKKGLTIDRIDNNGNYEPNNCRVISKQQQNRNYSRNIILKYNGKEKTLIDWCEILDLKYSMVYLRIKKNNWSVEKAFETPIRKSNKRDNTSLF